MAVCKFERQFLENTFNYLVMLLRKFFEEFNFKKNVKKIVKIQILGCTNARNRFTRTKLGI